jgi:hypothetical protein
MARIDNCEDEGEGEKTYIPPGLEIEKMESESLDLHDSDRPKRLVLIPRSIAALPANRLRTPSKRCRKRSVRALSPALVSPDSADAGE